jgi:TRAP-type C4-dicarboxylate transport system substrate-binding protein
MEHINRRDVVMGGAALAGATALAGPAWSKDYNLTLVSGSQIQFIWNKLIHDVFIPEANGVLKAAGDSANWKELYGTTVKRGGEIQAVRDGVADLSFATLTAYVSELPLQNITYVVPFGALEMGGVASSYHALCETSPAIGETYGRYDQVYIAPLPVPSYQLWTKFPVKSVEDLKGVKLGTSGLVGEWLKGTGAVPVESHFPGFYNDIKNGVYDGALTWLYVGNGLKLVEVAPHVTLVGFGAVCPAAITVSKKVWNSSPAMQKALKRGGERWLEECLKGQAKMESDARGIIEKAGGKFRDVSAQERAKWAAAVDEVPAQWAEAVEKTGLPAKKTLKDYLAALESKGVKLPRQWKV